MKPSLNKIETEVVISHAGVELMGILAVPSKAKSVIIFAHGSGSGRWSERNNFVARTLQKRGHSTLLMDLLTEEEALDRNNVFDISLLAKRVNFAKAWLKGGPLRELKLGIFGASTGAAAALVAAAQDPSNIFAVVSRGGRPDLAKSALTRVQAPTLLIVGGHDYAVIELNQQAFRALHCEKSLQIVPGATHLFEEPGTLEKAAHLAGEWFDEHVEAYTQEESRTAP